MGLQKVKTVLTLFTKREVTEEQVERFSQMVFQRCPEVEEIRFHQDRIELISSSDGNPLIWTLLGIAALLGIAIWFWQQVTQPAEPIIPEWVPYVIIGGGLLLVAVIILKR